MNNLEKIEYINKFYMLDTLKEDIKNFNKHKDFLSNIDKEIEKSLKIYFKDNAIKYANELKEEFKNNIDELIKLIKLNCDDTVDKMFWLKHLKDINIKI